MSRLLLWSVPLWSMVCSKSTGSAQLADLFVSRATFCSWFIASPSGWEIRIDPISGSSVAQILPSFGITSKSVIFLRGFRHPLQKCLLFSSATSSDPSRNCWARCLETVCSRRLSSPLDFTMIRFFIQGLKAGDGGMIWFGGGSMGSVCSCKFWTPLKFLVRGWCATDIHILICRC
jgi:hypothetical protein